MHPPTRFIPVPQWAGFHPWPSAHGWRWIVRDPKHELAPCIVRRSGRILIDEQRFLELMSSSPPPKGRKGRLTAPAQNNEHRKLSAA
jgi:hypothetical protein